MPAAGRVKHGNKFKDLTGRTFGNLFVVRLDGVRNGCSWWLCRCECGREREFKAAELKRGTKSCGCSLRRQSYRNSVPVGRHGASNSPTYRSWSAMLGRCLNPASSHYPRYGGRGIRVCNRWLDFSSFMADMGERPSSGHTIDRIDNDGHYCPENCRWATAKEQGRNRGNNRLIEWQGKTHTIAEWTEILGFGRGRIQQRLGVQKWSVERALSTPAGKRKTRS